MATYYPDGSQGYDPVQWDQMQSGSTPDLPKPTWETPKPADDAFTVRDDLAPSAPSYGGYHSQEDQSIANAYKNYLGRSLDPYSGEFNYWRGVKDYEQGIYGSQEAQWYRKQQGERAPTAGAAPTTQAWDSNAFSSRFGTPRTPQELLAMESQLNQAGIKVLRNAAGVAGKIQLPNGQVVDVITAAGAGGRGFQWLTDEGGGGAPQGGGFRPNVGGSAFSDPATSQWEQLVRQMVERLNQPIPQSTHELQQTQALDPLARQREQMKRQTELRLAQRGHRPGGGVFEESMRDIDRQFNELQTRTQAGFANTAAQQTEDRQLAGVNLFKQIPQYQDVRLQLAQNALMPANPMQLLSLQQNQQQMANQNQMYQNAQNQQFMEWLGLMLSEAFK